MPSIVFFGIAVDFMDDQILIFHIIHNNINIPVGCVLDHDRFAVQLIPGQRVILLEDVGAAIRVRDGEEVVRAGGEVTNARLPISSAQPTAKR